MQIRFRMPGQVSINHPGTIRQSTTMDRLTRNESPRTTAFVGWSAQSFTLSFAFADTSGISTGRRVRTAAAASRYGTVVRHAGNGANSISPGCRCTTTALPGAYSAARSCHPPGLGRSANARTQSNRIVGRDGERRRGALRCGYDPDVGRNTRHHGQTRIQGTTACCARESYAACHPAYGPAVAVWQQCGRMTRARFDDDQLMAGIQVRPHLASVDR